jgi:hypothetical protein
MLVKIGHIVKLDGQRPDYVDELARSFFENSRPDEKKALDQQVR